MAYVYGGNNYRAGAAGVQSDLDLRDYFAQQAAQSAVNGQGLPTSQQTQAARQELAPIHEMYQGIAANGMYSPQMQEQLLSARVQEVNNTTQAMQQNLNAQQAARGMGANAGQSAAVGMRGQFAAAGQRGQALADVTAANVGTQMQGVAGLANTAGQMAGYTAMGTRIDEDQQDYMGMYDQWRNAQVGYDGAKWGSNPKTPAHYEYGADAGGGDEMFGKKKKKQQGMAYGGGSGTGFGGSF